MLKILTDKDNEEIRNYIDMKVANRFVFSCKAGDLALVKCVLDQFNPRTDKYISSSLNTALVFACKKNHLEIAQLLIASGANPAAVNNAAFKASVKHLRMMKYLYEFPIVDPTDDNYAALKITVKKGYLESFKYLISLPSCKDIVHFDNNYLLRKAAEFGQLPIIEILMTLPKVDPAVSENYPFIIACANGHVHVAKYLLRFPSVKVNAQNNAALNLAAEYGHDNVISYLIHIVKITDTNAIDKAIANNHMDVVELLLPVISPSKQAIKYAVTDGYLEIIKLILSYKSEIDIDYLIVQAKQALKDDMLKCLIKYRDERYDKKNFFQRIFN